MDSRTHSSKSSSKSSSKASSRDSSPSNSIRGIPLGLLTEVQLEKLCDKIELLLDDTKALDLLCEKANDYEEFPALLYRFFFVHDKTHTLLRWALEKDINSLSPNELFRGETMATRLFYWQFFGDLGKRFLTSILATLLEQFATLDHSVEIDPHRVNPPDSVNPEANLKWLIQKLDDFVVQLQDSADHCPLGLRESFLFLKDVVGSKVENSSVFIASVLFLRLICPCLVLPEQYEILATLNLKLTEHGKRGLVLASKLLQSAANNSPWENRFGAEQVNEFIARANPLIVTFASKLIDEDIINLGRKVIKASISPVSSFELKQTHEGLTQFISSRILNREQLKSEIDYQQKYQLAMKHMKSNDWKVTATGPKTPECEYYVAQLKDSGSSNFVAKYSGRFKLPYELVKEYCRLESPDFFHDHRIEEFDTIERFDEHHCDMRVVIAAVFPIGPRDLIYKRRNFEESANRWLDITYSVERPDKPPTKKFIRAHANLIFSMVERDPSDPQYTLYNSIWDMDLKGWVPAYVINKTLRENLTVLEKIVHEFMSLPNRKEPFVQIKKRDPLPEDVKKKQEKGKEKNQQEKEVKKEKKKKISLHDAFDDDEF